MHAPAFLTELVVVFGVAVVVVLVLSRFRLPTIAGFIVAGALIGPGGLALVGGEGEGGTARIEALADVGVVLLLFTIGLEFSLARLRLIWRTIAMGGGLQVGLTIAASLGRIHRADTSDETAERARVAPLGSGPLDRPVD